MSPKETASGGEPRSTGPSTPVSMPLHLTLLAPAVLGGACGFSAANRRRS
ncbi:hypothetical protein Q5762_24165 [Streptomyces sp. P9(2023)]|nr:hypothetical protein [Streptomyces sp. P9(2023)]MDT9691383.1 hypothetical protein [Streptomyces sp. P9(2023)]